MVDIRRLIELISLSALIASPLVSVVYVVFKLREDTPKPQRRRYVRISRRRRGLPSRRQ